MATIHVIYDPDDRVVPFPVGSRPRGILTASMPCRPDGDPEAMRELVQKVAALLMEQVAD